MAGEAEEGGEQGQRSDRGDGDDGGRGGGEPRHERQAHQDHAEQRDDDRGARERDGPAGGIEGNDGCVLDRGSRVQVLPESGHDEERVVDADTEAEHHGDRRGEVGDRQDVGQQSGEDRSHPDAGKGDADGETHGEHRPEGEDEHDHGERQAQQLRARYLELGEDRSPDLDLDTCDLRHQLLQLRADGGRLLERDVAREPDLGIRDEAGLRTLRGDLLRPFRGVRADDRDPLDLAGSLEEGGHRSLHFGVGDALLGAEHDRSALATRARVGEVLIEDVEPAAALHIGKSELRAVRGAEHAADAAGNDQRGQPEQDDLAPVAETPTPELGKHDCSSMTARRLGG